MNPAIAEAWAPPPRLSVSEWADSELIVPDRGTRWRSYPYQRGILDAFNEPGIETVVLMTSAQVGKTSCALALIAYHIVHDPCSILVVQPSSRPMAEDFSKQRFDVLARKVPSLAAAVDRKRSADATNTTLLKTFTGGLIAFAGANSAASLSSRAIRFLVLDEIDQYPLELQGQGSTIETARERTQTFGDEKRVLKASTPTIENAPIDYWFQLGDQRRFHVPCPSCGAMFFYEWGHVRWAEGEPGTALLNCPECDHGLNDDEKQIVQDDGEWIPGAEAEDKSVASFHLWAAYSPSVTLSELATQFLRAVKLKREEGEAGVLDAFVQRKLGQPVGSRAKSVEPNVVLARREQYGVPVPAGACYLTCGIDTQDDRLEALVVGWGPGEESWFVDKHELSGNTAVDTQTGPWAMLDELLDREYVHASGVTLPIAVAAMDSAGHRTTEVYDYCARKGGRVLCTIGRSGPSDGIVAGVSRKRTGRDRRKCDLWTVGIDEAKTKWMDRVELLERGPGFVHVPDEEWAGEEFARQLTSEEKLLKYRRGRPYYTWQKKPGARNEVLDCAVLAMFALKWRPVDLDALAKKLLDTEPPPTPTRPPQREPWMGNRAKGFLRRR